MGTKKTSVLHLLIDNLEKDAVNFFVEWLHDNGYSIGKYERVPGAAVGNWSPVPNKRILADYFNE